MNNEVDPVDMMNVVNNLIEEYSETSLDSIFEVG